MQNLAAVWSGAGKGLKNKLMDEAAVAFPDRHGNVAAARWAGT